MKYISSYALFFFFLWLGIYSGEVSGQISSGGTPVSFGAGFQGLSKNIRHLNIEKVPALDMQKIKEEDAKAINSTRFAAAIPVKYNLKNSGKWVTLKNKDRVWRLKLQAKGALSLRVLFDKFWLPEGARMFIYSEDKQEILGAFTSRNNKPTGRFATNVIHSSTVTVEYYEPHAVKRRGEVNIFRIDYGYRNTFPSKTNDKPRAGVKGFNDSGVCHQDINCPLGDDWQDEKRGVLKIVLTNIDGSDWCTGSLINTTARDRRPYVLSAHHCGYTSTGSGQEFIDTWIFIFNYEATGCNSATTEPGKEQSIAGATLLSTSYNTDFLLMELTERVPESYNAYFNGWDRSDAIPTSTVSIHHPSGDIKKISIDENSPSVTAYNKDDIEDNTHWRVVWDQSTTTERGSSGASLFNEQGKIIGQLHGGTASCDDPNAPDWYGRVHVSWKGEGTQSSRLSDWLDPLGIGSTELDGLENTIIGSDIGFYGLEVTANACAYDADTPVILKLINNGTTNQSNIEVAYELRRVDDNTLISSDKLTVDAVKSGGVSATEFNVNLEEPGEIYQFTATLNLSDENTGNNTMTHLVTIPDQPIIIAEFPYEESFEAGAANWTAGGLNSQWELGMPSGNVINQASSGSNAWVTNLTGRYGDNQNSYLLSPVFDFSSLQNPAISADIFVNTEADYDGTQLQVSIDCGKNWKALGALSSGENWYENDAGTLSFYEFTNIGWSEEESTWKNAAHSLEDYTGEEYVQFRFVFKSDENTNSEGFAVDNIKIMGDFVPKEKTLESELRLGYNSETEAIHVLLTPNTSFGESLKIMMYDIRGAKRKELNMPVFSQDDALQGEIFVGGITAGMYILKIASETETVTKSIVIIR